MTQREFHVGIDVSKHWLDVSCAGVVERIGNDPDAHARLAARLAARPVVAIGLEASGGYERGACSALRKAGLPVRLVDSYRLRQFAKATGRHAKTDPLDATMIARFIATVPAEPQPPADPAREKLAELVSFRGDLVEESVRLANQLAQLADDDLRAMAQSRREVTRQCLKRLERRIRDHLRSDPTLKRKADILQSAPGVGFVNAITLLATVPELGQRDARKIAALLGVAPYDNRSGRRDKGAHIRGGRATPRATLFLAVLSQLRRQTWAKDLRDRMTARGKPKMVAVVALMRKLVIALNAMIRDDRPWHEPATA